MSTDKHITDDGHPVYANAYGQIVNFVDAARVPANDQGISKRYALEVGIYPMIEMSTGNYLMSGGEPIHATDDGRPVTFVDSSIVSPADQGIDPEDPVFPSIYLLREMSTNEYITQRNQLVYVNQVGDTITFFAASQTHEENRGLGLGDPSFPNVYPLIEMSTGKYLTENDRPVFVDERGTKTVDIADVQEDDLGIASIDSGGGMFVLTEMSTGKYVLDKWRWLYVDGSGARLDFTNSSQEYVTLRYS